MAEAEVRRFEFRRCLGAGGFGEVYLASMRSVGGVESEVAVKVLHDGLDPRSQAVQRLRDEAKILGTLNHPAVLTVHDLVLLGGRVALVMEYVEGLDLEECLVLQPMIPTRPCLEIVSQICDALAAALVAPGSTGEPLALVHRDLKPSNIRVGRHGQVKLLDFGIAKAADARREAKTQTRLTMGSPWYMGPERFNYVNDDPASDVYALGCVLYECFSGGVRLLEEFSPRDHFLLAMNDSAHDAHVSQKVGALPEWIRPVLTHMLAFQASERPTVSALVTELEELSDRGDGPPLRRWTRELSWPAADAIQGALVGQSLTEERISAIDRATPVPLRTPFELQEPALRTVDTSADPLQGVSAAETFHADLADLEEEPDASPDLETPLEPDVPSEPDPTAPLVVAEKTAPVRRRQPSPLLPVGALVLGLLILALAVVAPVLYILIATILAVLTI